MIYLLKIFLALPHFFFFFPLLLIFLNVCNSVVCTIGRVRKSLHLFVFGLTPLRSRLNPLLNPCPILPHLTQPTPPDSHDFQIRNCGILRKCQLSVHGIIRLLSIYSFFFTMSISCQWILCSSFHRQYNRINSNTSAYLWATFAMPTSDQI